MLNVNQLSVWFKRKKDRLLVVDSVTFSLDPGKTLAIVGESGSGKSVTALAIMGLLPGTACVEGSIRYQSQELIGASEASLRPLRGKKIGLIFQNPRAALNPVFSIENQLVETICYHQNVLKKEALTIAIRLLERVKIDNAAARISDYPHQFSLGMCQRIMIALTLAMKPAILIADEPTASLDVTTQKDILELIAELKEAYAMSMIFISHDLGVVSKHSDDVLVMYLGKQVEYGSTHAIFSQPQRPYTQKLLDAIVRL